MNDTRSEMRDGEDAYMDDACSVLRENRMQDAESRKGAVGSERKRRPAGSVSTTEWSVASGFRRIRSRIVGTPWVAGWPGVEDPTRAPTSDIGVHVLALL